METTSNNTDKLVVLTNEQIFQLSKEAPFFIDNRRLLAIKGVGDGTIKLDDGKIVHGFRFMVNYGGEEEYIRIMASNAILLDLAGRLLELARIFDREVFTIDVDVVGEAVVVPNPEDTVEGEQDDTTIS